MQRVTISLDEELAQAFDILAAEQGYQSRSEAMRDLVRRAVETRRQETSKAVSCVASLSYIYDYRTRDVASRLSEITHTHHDLVVSTIEVPLDHRTCFANAILKGPTTSVQALADGVRSERGVRFGAINIISVHPNDNHDTPEDHAHRGHVHLTPHPG